MSNLLLAAIESASQVTAQDATIQSTAKLSNGRFSGWSIDYTNCVIWSGNLNRVEWGNIEALAQYIIENGVPGIIEGFVKDGLLQVTDGARRLTAINYAIANLGYTPEKIKYVPVQENEFQLLARQINSESLNKTFTEKMIIVEKMKAISKEDGSFPTLTEIASACGMSIAAISELNSVIKNAEPEIKEDIKSGKVSGYAVAETIREAKKAAKKGEKSEVSQANQVAATKAAKVAKTDNRVALLTQVESLLSKEPEFFGSDMVSLEMSKSEYTSLMNALAEYQVSR